MPRHPGLHRVFPDYTRNRPAAPAAGRRGLNLVAAKILLYCDLKVGPEQWAQAHFFIGFDAVTEKTE